MGLSVSVSFAVLSIALFMSIAVLIDAADLTLRNLEKGVEGKVDRTVNTARTRVSINNVTLNGTGASMNITNTGSVTLAVKGVSVMINGSYVNGNITEVTAGGKISNIWAPGEVLRLEFNCTASVGERVKVVSGNGVVSYGVMA